MFAIEIIQKNRNKAVQQGAIGTLTKIIVNSPDEVLFLKLDELTDRMVAIVRSKYF